MDPGLNDMANMQETGRESSLHTHKQCPAKSNQQQSWAGFSKFILPVVRPGQNQLYAQPDTPFLQQA